LSVINQPRSYFDIYHILTSTITPQDVLERGLKFVGIGHKGKSARSNLAQFLKHYGSTCLDLAEVRHDLMHEDLPIPKTALEKIKKLYKINENERSEKEFKMFLVSQFFCGRTSKTPT
jgi:hypothetical protein